MNSSDSAEELIKIYLDGVGFTLRIAGEGSKNLIAILIAMSKDKTQTKGKTRLTNMLKTGKEVKIFTLSFTIGCTIDKQASFPKLSS